MNITYNNLTNSENILTFTDVPNILKLSEDVLGDKASLVFNFTGNLQTTVTASSQYYVTLFGESVTNVMDASNANNKRFFIGSDNKSTAASFARALRDCGGINAEFDIIHSGTSVELVSKTIGRKGLDDPNALSRNISNSYLEVSLSEGDSFSDYFNSKINVDVYGEDEYGNEKYITSLEKNWYGNSCAFSVSPILSTMSEYGTSKPYSLNIQAILGNGDYRNLGSVSGNTAIGFRINDSDPYKIMNGTSMAINTNLPMKHYTYFNSIKYSVICSPNTAGWTTTISLLDSAANAYWTTAETRHRTSSNYLIDDGVDIPQSAFTNAFYVDVTVGNETTRYDVIKPLKAAEGAHRVLWRNEYGGIEFFDFTSSSSETNAIENETYEKNIYDYYETDAFEQRKIYKKELNKTVTLESHLILEEGTLPFNSLAKSKSVWLEDGNTKKYIIIKSVDVSEESNYNGIYRVRVGYEYSNKI